MPSWLWIVIVVALVALLGYRLATRGREQGTPVATSAPVPPVETPSAPPAEPAGSAERHELERDAGLRHDQGYTEIVEPEPQPEPDPQPEPQPEPDPVPDGDYGPGSTHPNADGSPPSGYPVKANADSMLFSTPDSPGYQRSAADAYFTDVDAAEAAGFHRWEKHRT